jgi:hypothetical protein
VNVPDDFRPPWICWWIADWAGSDRVAQLDPIPRLVLVELFWLEGRSGPFEPEAKALARRIRLDLADVERALPLLTGFFDVLPDGRWSNRKAAKERTNAFIRSQRASAGAEGRWKGHEAGSDAKRNAKRNARTDAREHAWKDAQEHAPDHAASRLTSHSSHTHNAETQENRPHESPSAPARKRATLSMDAAKDLLPAEHAAELGTAWRGWVEHLWARKRPTPGALAKHLEALARVVAARGYPAAVKLLDEAVGANAQGLQPWAIDAALRGPAVNGHGLYQRRETAAEAAHRSSQEALDRVLGVDSRTRLSAL